MSTEKERETQVYMAKLSEQAERYNEMVECMKSVAKLDVELTVEERNLLSVGYKNVIGARRASWRIMSSIEQKEESKGNENNVKLIKGYRQKVEEELSTICSDILSIIDKHLIPASTTGEATVFYHKMKGDYCRYLAEFKSDQDRKEAAEQALKGYEAASGIASTDLPSTHPIRLGLALNFSVFYYEIMNSPERACHLAKQAFDEAIAELDSLSEESYKDSTLIMQLLRDNLTLWTSDLPEDGGNVTITSKARILNLLLQNLRNELFVAHWYRIQNQFRKLFIFPDLTKAEELRMDRFGLHYFHLSYLFLLCTRFPSCFCSSFLLNLILILLANFVKCSLVFVKLELRL